MRIRFWPKTESGSLNLKLREIFKSLLKEYFRSFFKPFFVSYFWCQTSPVSPRAPEPVRIWTDSDPGWFSESSTSIVRLTPKKWKQKRRLLILYYLKYLFYRLLKISIRLRYRAPDPVFWPKPDPHPCFFFTEPNLPDNCICATVFICHSF